MPQRFKPGQLDQGGATNSQALVWSTSAGAWAPASLESFRREVHNISGRILNQGEIVWVRESISSPPPVNAVFSNDLVDLGDGFGTDIWGGALGVVTADIPDDTDGWVVIGGKCQILVIPGVSGILPGNALFLMSAKAIYPDWTLSVAGGNPDQGYPICFVGIAEEELPAPTVPPTGVFIKCNLRPQTPPFEPVFRTSGRNTTLGTDKLPVTLFTLRPDIWTIHRITVEGMCFTGGVISSFPETSDAFSFAIVATFIANDSGGVTQIGQTVQLPWHSNVEGFGADLVIDDTYGSGDQRIAFRVIWAGVSDVDRYWTWAFRDVWANTDPSGPRSGTGSGGGSD